MTKVAIIGGTGLTSLKGLTISHEELIKTPYGDPSAPLIFGELSGNYVLFLPRHGVTHTIPPHKINYRANLWALKEQGISEIIAVNAVGAIHPEMTPGKVVIPHQIIDYTHSRINTFFEEGLKQVTHIDFSYPYCESLRKKLINAATLNDVEVMTAGVYGATQGPRLETAAEITRMQNDGCDLVGMTGMPEAALARELGLCYGAIAVVANMAAGIVEEEITMEMIEHYLVGGMESVRKLLEYTLTQT
jgi:5'-deoxy-5'-methylthioadenosine phosphorylase